MASTTRPLLASLETDITSLASLPHDRPPTSSGLSRPLTPHHLNPLTLHAYHKLQQSAAPPSSPLGDYKRVRRKPSLDDLVGQPTDASSWSARSEEFPHLPNPSSPQHHLPSTPPSLLPTKSPGIGASSPSLSSTIATVPSSPTSTPFEDIDHCRTLPFDLTSQLDPLRTKRNFGELPKAKRLPHRNSDPWEIFAVVQVSSGSSSSRGIRRVGSGVCSRGPVVAPLKISQGAAQSEQEIRGLLGTHDEEALGAFGNQEGWVRFRSLGLDEKETFGHPDGSSPPTSPATLHYRGTSFNLVNPHASLLLGTSRIETPTAELDCLLDDYFDQEPIRYDNSIEDMSSQFSGEDLMPYRQLYDDPDEARRTILTPRSQRAATEARDAAAVNSGDDPVPASTPDRADRPESSIYPPSYYRRSAPFDLTVSDVDEERATELARNGNSTVSGILDDYDYTRQPATTFEDRQSTATFEDRQPTATIEDAHRHLSNIPSSIEDALCSLEGRERPSTVSQNTSDDSWVEGAINAKDAYPEVGFHEAIALYKGHRRLDNRHVSPPPCIPAPPPPAVFTSSHEYGPPAEGQPDPNRWPMAALRPRSSRRRHKRGNVYDGTSELPTSERTYGDTNQLLQVPPRRPSPLRRPSTPPFQWALPSPAPERRRSYVQRGYQQDRLRQGQYVQQSQQMQRTQRSQQSQQRLQSEQSLQSLRAVSNSIGEYEIGSDTLSTHGSLHGGDSPVSEEDRENMHPPAMSAHPAALPAHPSEWRFPHRHPQAAESFVPRPLLPGNPFEPEEGRVSPIGDNEADWETERSPQSLGTSDVLNCARREGSTSSLYAPDALVDLRNPLQYQSRVQRRRPLTNARSAVQRVSSFLSLQLQRIATAARTPVPTPTPVEDLERDGGANSLELRPMELRHDRNSNAHEAVQYYVEEHGLQTSTELDRVRMTNSPRHREHYRDNSFDQVLKQSRKQEEQQLRSRSSEHRLAAIDNREVNGAPLQYSPTMATFATVPGPSRTPARRRPARTDDTITPPLQAMTSSGRHGSHLRPGQRPYGRIPIERSMASMSSQTGLRDLHLTSTPTSHLRGTIGDTQLERRSRSFFPWRLTRQHRATTPAPARPESLELQPVRRRVEPVTHADEVRLSPTLDPCEQHVLSRACLAGQDLNTLRCAQVCFGWYDRKIRAQSAGRVEKVIWPIKVEAFALLCGHAAMLLSLVVLVLTFTLIGIHLGRQG